jgi:hypothetical protein
MGTRLHASSRPAGPLRDACGTPRPAAIRRRAWLAALALVAVLTACNTLPNPYLDPHGQETIHSVIEQSPGQWHVLVRVNYFSSDNAAERLLRQRVAHLCPEGDLVVDHLHVAGVPRIATADVHCAGSETTAPDTTESPAAQGPGADTSAVEPPTTGSEEVAPFPDSP